jgi:DNA-binding transcriptional ArsR family regulator
MKIEKLLPKAEKAEAFLKALASKHRLMVLCELHLGERSVGALVDAGLVTASGPVVGGRSRRHAPRWPEHLLFARE